MSGPWEQYAQPERGPWAMFDQGQPREGSGIGDAWTAGYQRSLAGLIDRGKLPDVVLTPEHSKWYERAIASVSQMVNEGPEMLAGAVAGGAAGSVAGPVGTVIGAGAGSFAVPTAIRESYIQALEKGAITNSGDFLSRAAIVLKQTGKDAAVGALTAGAGKAAGVGASALGLGAKATAATTLGAEGAAMVIAPSALEGKMPESQDFLDAAILLGGLKGATSVAGRLRTVYAKTGKTPVEVMADAKSDPTLADELVNGPKAPEVKAPEIVSTEPTPAAEPTYNKDARVGVQAIDPETGEMAETTMRAEDALRDNAQRSEKMKGLLECLRG